MQQPACACATQADHEIVEGFRVCNKCGMILEQTLESMEWFSADDVRQRASVFSGDVSTIGSGTTDNVTSKLHKGLNSKAQNQARVTLNAHELLSSAVCELQLGAAVGAEAASILRMSAFLYEAGRGNRRQATVAACISLACQKFSVGLCDKHLLERSRLETRLKSLNVQKRNIVLHLHDKGVTDVACRPDPAIYAVRICKDLNFNAETTAKVKEYAARLTKSPRFKYKTPTQITTLAILGFIDRFNLNLNVNNLVQITNITRPTLTKWFASACGINLQHARKLLLSLDNK